MIDYFDRSIDDRNKYTKQVMNKHGANDSPWKNPMTMSKESKVNE